MAVQLGYREVYRYAAGLQEWHANGLAVTRAPAGAEAPAPDRSGNLPWTLLGVFLGGMALNLTPCVYPLLPTTVSYFAARGDRGKGTLLAHAGCYVAGVALTNTLLGVSAALSGGLLGSSLRHPAVLGGVAAVQLALAASLFGFWELRLPAGFRRMASRSFSGWAGSVFMGLTMGLVAAPCIGPFVLGLLTWVAGSGSVPLGFAVFFTLSLGLGLPLLGLALLIGRIDRLPQAGAWLVWVRRLMGWVLVGIAIRVARPLVPPDLGLTVFAAAGLAAAWDLGWRARAGDSRLFALVRLGAGTLGMLLVLTLVGGRLLRGPAIAWRPYSDKIIAAARREGKPVVIDFSAAWCTPCRSLEEETFRDRRVVELARAEFVMLKVDLTASGDALSERLVRDYAVRGVPTIVFLGADGREHRALRVIDHLPADDFLARMMATQVSP